ncbi:MAG: hypothetical protein A2946_00030 [Candidatus Liptonbacteria bacterium RIFCSPLOWO2_01_FULL_53_13]|uniref:Peptidoglycan binding-like domain-containing protein n=1 Tax=Candidatus Liptonbacteria bacterium RIFCSPLOWO2_01_FULL_53_13 TaxID=1798651 RepID=A0A1G2CIM7_9BACT|nr:MAG: hypothetical protein A2946_00030 [Candidatus Liptonbacteria bacterium RIFCSPLOWO2_01_FULL_53_13]
MKNFKKNSATILIISFVLGLSGPIAALAASPATVNLGASGNFAILAKTGVSTTGATSVVGDIGLSPAAASYITGFALTLPAASAFSTSAQVTGKVYAPGYADPTPANLTTAVLDMQTAYTDAMGRAPGVTELGAGNIGGLTLAPDVYKWGTGLTIPTDVTLSGGANDIWIFQVAQNLNISSAKKVILAGGARANNIFWVVAGQTTLGTTSVFNGNILGQTAIVLNTGATLNGRALAQTAVTLDSNAVAMPSSAGAPATPTPTPTPAPTSSPAVQTSTPSPIACTMEAMQCSDGSYVSRQGPTCAFAACPLVVSQTPPTASSDANAALQAQLNGLRVTLQSLQAQRAAQQGSSASAFGQQVRAIATNLGQGSRGNDVETLQQFLISQNKGPDAEALAEVGATAYFGAMTRAALAEFQAEAGISPALGNFGPITRDYVKANY